MLLCSLSWSVNQWFGDHFFSIFWEFTMWWPFGGKKSEPRMVLSSFSLTDDEHRECEAYLKSIIPQTEGGAWYMPAEAAEVLKRGMVAVCMMGRAERFA